MKAFLVTLAAVVALVASSTSSAAELAEYPRVYIVTVEKATPIEQNIAKLLQDRLSENGGPEVSAGVDTLNPARKETLTIVLGVPERHNALAAFLADRHIPVLTERNPGPEGFLVLFDEKTSTLAAAGVDTRGTLYAVGEVLRRVLLDTKLVKVPNGLNVRTAPAFEVRGTQFGQSSVAKNLGRVRDWTDDELHRDILDSALAGANTFDTKPGPEFDFLKSFGLMANHNHGPNIGNGPPEWQAAESIGRDNYLCPSVPEARKALLEKCEETFSRGPDFDFVKLVGGDGGGCECDKCKPYGLTFIKLCEDMAAIIHKYHPKTRIWFTNQKFQDADDQAIFKYLQEKPREWLWAWGYGPGSDAMSWQPGHRQTHRMDLFRYPGYGPFDRYNQEIMHQLPPQQTLLHYNEITHWRYAQHAYAQMYPRADKNGDQPPWWNHFIYERRPDQAITMVYDRLTFYAWPKFYHWVFGEVNRYGVGDITHSSGTHDHFNQWMWQRLLWAPHTRVEDVVDEYCRTWFGPEAAPDMAQALFQMEDYLQEDRTKPITEMAGVARYHDLVQSAGLTMPPFQMKNNWLWREYMQKGALDKYIKLNLIQQVELQSRIEKRVAETMATPEIDAAIDAMLPWFDTIEETAELRALREDAERLGEESNTLYGVRSEGIFNLKHDYIGLGWTKRQLERAKAERDPAAKKELLRMIVAYDDPGEGGFYDNCGTFNPCPRVTKGYPYDHGQPYVTGMLSEGNRPSQRSMHFTQDESPGVTLKYGGLDPKGAYRVRMTLVRPWFQERYAMRMNQKSQSIYADDSLLAKDVELPLQMSDFFTYDIPREATQDGELTLRLEKVADVAVGDRVSVEQWRNSGGWGTLVSEVWLMKR
jgi:hypothetical protein